MPPFALSFSEVSMLEIGNNSYVDLEFANAYVEKYNIWNAPLRVHWSVLTDDEKESYLHASLSQIEKLKFIGRKVIMRQPLQFPRYISQQNLVGCYHTFKFGIQDGTTTEIPIDVQEAQVENALGIISEQISAISDKQFMTLQSLGAVKNTKYNKREAGDIGFSDELKGGTGHVEIASLRAYQLLKPYVGGTFRC